MRREFQEYLFKKMKENQDIWLICMDLGYKIFDKHFETFPERCINPGAAESAGLGLATGLALSGKKPFVYSITPFLIYRPFETIRNYISHEKIPVCLVGSGRDKDYSEDGWSHDASDVKSVLDSLPGISQFYPNDNEHMTNCVDAYLKNDLSMFISLRR